MAGAAIAVRYFLGWPWLTAALFGSLVIVTGPTVVGPLVRNLHLRPRVATVLEAEGVMIDPIGVLIAVLMLELTLAPGAESIANEAGTLLFRVGFGAVVGAAAGFAIAGLLRVKRLIPEGQENIFVLASVLLLSEGCNAVVSHSGILAVTVAGIVVGNLPTSVDREMREFKDQLTSLLIGLLFILLAANVRLTDVEDLGWSGVAVVACLIFVVRPITVAFSTRGSTLAWRERAFIAWIAPRGIVAASSGVSHCRRARASGDRRRFTARRVGVSHDRGDRRARGPQRGPRRDAALAAPARARRNCNTRMRVAWVFYSARSSGPRGRRWSSSTRTRPIPGRGEEAGFTVIFGDALQERTLQRARFDLVGDAVGVTPNQMLNSIFVSRARERFRVPRSYVAVDQPESGLAPELVGNEQAVVLFDGAHDVGRWEVRDRHDEIDVEHWEYIGLSDHGEAAEQMATSGRHREANSS